MSSSARKHQAITNAAAAAFLEKGYLGTSMDEIASLAGVSKQTVYKHFLDKDRLFAQIVLGATDRVDTVVRLVASRLGESRDLQQDLTELGSRFLEALMEPSMLRLRRLIIANADRFPELGRAWYERGFERVLETLAGTFEHLADRGRLRRADQRLAAHHFVALLLWIPLNRAMFTGERRPIGKSEIRAYAQSATRAFLAGYGPERR